MFEALAETLQQALAAHAHKSRKVLVVDLDNTLWGGTVGEAGPLGIVSQSLSIWTIDAAVSIKSLAAQVP